LILVSRDVRTLPSEKCGVQSRSKNTPTKLITHMANLRMLSSRPKSISRDSWFISMTMYVQTEHQLLCGDSSCTIWQRIQTGMKQKACAEIFDIGNSHNQSSGHTPDWDWVTLPSRTVDCFRANDHIDPEREVLSCEFSSVAVFCRERAAAPE
jgi:hypothetical protein